MGAASLDYRAAPASGAIADDCALWCWMCAKDGKRTPAVWAVGVDTFGLCPDHLEQVQRAD